MIVFYKGQHDIIYAVGVSETLKDQDLEKLAWLFGDATQIKGQNIEGYFVGPRKEMITPWSTNAVEITQNMGIKGIFRIEEYHAVNAADAVHDPMLQIVNDGLDQDLFTIHKQPEPILHIEDIRKYNEEEGLALSEDEIIYLESVSKELGRKLTDSEVFGFSQVNSEHCRHKIFNGTFIIDGEEKEASLFQLIKKTSKTNPNKLVSAYKDNVAFVKGPELEQFAPETQDKPDFFKVSKYESVLSLKAETHNFPTTVEPFNGAATGTGGEIRDRMAGGKASIPLAGTAVYMTPYSRLEEGRKWEGQVTPRKWLYQTPLDLLIKASNGASDYGNKFGQPLICGSVLTFEHVENGKHYGYDKVIMQAGGVGYGKLKSSQKGNPEKGDKIIVLGGDNYRIGMGGSAVSSVATGEFDNAIELNAVQRANPEMQKRVANAIRAMAEADENSIVSIHDHGAGGHLNCLSELVENAGGNIDIKALPVGDPTLSDKEIAGNESQERMGLVMKGSDTDLLKKVADRERAPMYIVGEVTGDGNFRFINKDKDTNPIDWKLAHMFGNSPKTVLEDTTSEQKFAPLEYNHSQIQGYLESVLQLEAVACKDWLTNKVDRSVTGKVATQQTAGAIQLPLNNVAVMALDYRGKKGIATAIGHAPISALIDPAAGSRLSIAEALTNLVWAPLTDELKGVSLSANWMWPAKNEGEDARLYKAVEAASDFACALGINIPTGKDSLSMKQKYPDGKEVYSPGTVIISAAAEVEDVTKVVSPVLSTDKDTSILYIDLSRDKLVLGGSSFAQILNKVGEESPNVKDVAYFGSVFNAIQQLIKEEKILAGHDISAGGLVTALLEMNFANEDGGLNVNLDSIKEQDLIKLLFSENPGLIIQVKDLAAAEARFKKDNIDFHVIGQPIAERHLKIAHNGQVMNFDIDSLRDTWFKTSYLLDQHQSGAALAKKRFEHYKVQPLQYKFPNNFTGRLSQYGLDPDRKGRSGYRAAIIREKGVNGDREMAYSLYLAGFDVKDVHMTDLISGRETLEDIHLIVFVGGFSNSDVLGSAKGWAGAFLYNEKAKTALDNFYKRSDTLSLGVCNGCQLMTELGLVYPDHKEHPKMRHNSSGKFESCFVNVTIQDNNSVMFKSLAGTRLGVWVAHGEGKFHLPYEEASYHVTAKYSYQEYPGNPNDSKYAIASICSDDGRHLAIMPHIERSIFAWNWPYYPSDRKDEVSPWIEAFVNAREWIKSKVKA